MYSSCERHKTVSVFPPENLKLPILHPSCKGVNTDHPPPAWQNPRRPPEAELKVSLGEGAGYTHTSNMACVQS